MAEHGLDLEATHPDYDAWSASWKLMRDVFDGDESVKAEGETYLPMPSGFAAMDDGGTAAYSAYQTRAQFPEIVSPTIRGMAGVIHRKPAQVFLPTALEPLIERATRDGLTLDALHRRMTREVLQTGRFGLLPDLSSTGERPYLATYTAEAIRNWGEDDDQQVTFVVLDESGNTFDPDTLRWEERERWRLLQLVDGAYQVRVFERIGESVEEITDEAVRPQRRAARPLDVVPFVFIDTNDLTPAPDEVPMLGLGRIALAIYRLDADYRHQMYNTGQEMWAFIGYEPNEAPKVIGAGGHITLPIGGDAKVIGPQGTGIGAHRTAIQDEYERATRFGAQFFEARHADAESGEAMRLRRSTETATLTSISQNVAAGLERALKHLAVWLDADPDEVIIEANTDFVEQRMSPNEINSLVASWTAGAISHQTLYENLQAGEIASAERDFDEEKAQITEEEVASLGLDEVEVAPEDEPAVVE